MIFKDYYKILGLETNKVTREEIKLAFREQAKKYHPDVNAKNTRTEEIFKDINEAYRVLSDSNSKRKYDRTWNAKIKRKQNRIKAGQKRTENKSAFSEIKEMFFGEKTEIETEKKVYKKIPIKGENIETEINIKLEEAYFGTEKKISLRTVKRKNEKFFSESTIWN